MKKLVALVAFTVAPCVFAQGQPRNPPAPEASYVLKVEAPPAKKGQKSVAKIRITPGAGFHMNKEYPTSLVLSTVPAGVSVDKMKLTMKDAAKWEETGG